MTLVLKAMALGATGRQGQYRVFTVQGLNGGLLIHTEHRRMGGRVKIQPNNIGGSVMPAHAGMTDRGKLRDEAIPIFQ